ncbi:hypothetical protein O181_079993 [Austropuccinia psidii MF-1]|uniref:Reverse transcriptase RNase H-like domain-containing protein n=1 Tax=Austropuccinia psidii MF-1 TaxID=1389203 RepID=A0A9Q3IG50_9BASI|nr:hypothetical protein [Austropuccinia psidii MF-1]
MKIPLRLTELPEKIPLILMDSSESPPLFVTHHIEYMVELPSFSRFEWDFLVIHTPKGEDLILGFAFLNHFNTSVDWRQGLITFNSDKKDYHDPSKSFSDDFSSAKSCAALSLLSSIDEVFKEIKDFGEDNSVSSLHLFFCNMDLPPSYYHDSLEELWDEEEEPEETETIMKVSPSAYHQYLDVFSKVRAEKLPPHHTCDHYIELEGSLPQVGVIYSLSNQESDTLRAYILEKVEKETDASDYALGSVLSQVSDSGKDPIAFDSCKLLPEELNYEVHDKELLGTVWAVKGWRAFLLSLYSSFEVITNHSSLQYFMSSKILTFCQACWAEFLSEFHFLMTYRPGHLATLPNAL